MEDSDAEGNETEALVTQRPAKDEKAFAATSGGLFPSSSSSRLKADATSHLGGTSSSSPHPPALPSRPPKDPSKGGSGPRKSFQDPSLNTLHESTEEPTLEEVHLPERKDERCKDAGHPYLASLHAGSSSSYILCPFFGVRNYLHNFYERPKDPREMVVPGRDDACMVKRRRGRYPPSVFRLSLILGSIILLMGAIAFVVAACTSRRTTLIGKIGGVPVEDRLAAAHNAEVDALLLVGMTAVTLGAAVLVGALISQVICFPSDYEETITNNFWAGQSRSIYEYPHWFYSMERGVPATEKVMPIQPCPAFVHRYN